METRPRFGFVALVLVASACSTTLNPGRCNQTSDCPTGQVCNLAPTVQGDGRCVAPSSIDGGGTGGATGAGGAGASTDGGGGGNSCAACGGNTPVCLQGSCVACAASSDCNTDATKPICDPTAHTCVSCGSDGQCAAKLGSTGNPGVCMSHLDGHCATDAETIYVQNTAGCTATYVNDSGGTAIAPYCSMDPVGLAANDTHTLVVIRGAVNGGTWTYQRGAGHPETSFIGQQSAIVASATSPGFSMTSGTAYIRDVKFSSSLAVCISATGGSIDLDTVVVDTCQGGGILLDGAAFNITNTTVTNNGPGTVGTTSWGGILVNSLPIAGLPVFSLDTIENNKGPGLECAGQVDGSAVLASGNSTADIGPTCGFNSCTPGRGACGAP